MLISIASRAFSGLYPLCGVQDWVERKPFQEIDYRHNSDKCVKFKASKKNQSVSKCFLHLTLAAKKGLDIAQANVLCFKVHLFVDWNASLDASCSYTMVLAFIRTTTTTGAVFLKQLQ